MRDLILDMAIIYDIILVVCVLLALYLSFHIGRQYERDVYKTSYDITIEHLDKLDKEMCELGKQMYGDWWECE